MNGDQLRQIFDGSKMRIVRLPNREAAMDPGWDPKPEDIVSEYDILVLPDDTVATVRNGEICWMWQLPENPD